MRYFCILATCLALLLAGCGGSDDDKSPAPASGGSETSPEEAPNTVEMRNIKFEPGQITVKVGDTVTWVNAEDIQHNVVADEGATFKSDLLSRDGTFKFKPDKAGTISYECTIHQGMVGTIKVR